MSIENRIEAHHFPMRGEVSVCLSATEEQLFSIEEQEIPNVYSLNDEELKDEVMKEYGIEIEDLVLQRIDQDKEATPYAQETIWRLTEDDFLEVMEDFNLTDSYSKELLEKAKTHFGILDWREHVRNFIQDNLES